MHVMCSGQIHAEQLERFPTMWREHLQQMLARGGISQPGAYVTAMPVPWQRRDRERAICGQRVLDEAEVRESACRVCGTRQPPPSFSDGKQGGGFFAVLGLDAPAAVLRSGRAGSVRALCGWKLLQSQEYDSSRLQAQGELHEIHEMRKGRD